jgi:uncharacterized membrane protein YqiK
VAMVSAVEVAARMVWLLNFVVVVVMIMMLIFFFSHDNYYSYSDLSPLVVVSWKRSTLSWREKYDQNMMKETTTTVLNVVVVVVPSM